jgi:TPR repeat protein
VEKGCGSRLCRSHVPAWLSLLVRSKTAKFVPDPDREAATWYFQAASAGHAEAQYHLGLLFLAGKGVIENRQEAARWMKKAASQGHPEAKKALNSIEGSR